MKLNQQNKKQYQNFWSVKGKKQKKCLSTNETDVEKQDLTFSCFRGTWKESQIDCIFVEYAHMCVWRSQTIWYL